MMRALVLPAILLIGFSNVPGAAYAQWIEARNEHFRVLTDANEKQARRVLDQFERIRWMFRTLFPDSNADPVEPIIVVAAKNIRSFQALEPPDYLAKGQLRLAGIFMRLYDKNYVLLRLDASFDHPFAPVYHEYTHLQLSGAAEWMPLWLNEGLAEFFQITDISDNNVWLGAASAENVQLLQRRPLIPLEVLFRVDRASPYYHQEQKGTMFYAECWALTHFLELADREQGTHRINDYLDMVRRRIDPVTAAEKAFGDLKSLENSLAAYIRAGQYRKFALTGAPPMEESECSIGGLSQPEADAVRADVLMGVHRDAEAQALLKAVLQSDPENVLAHETMATMEYRAGNPEAALKWYREAIRLSSQNYFVHFNFANLAMSGGKAWDDPQIERSLRTAVRLNPRYYPASEFLATLLSSFNRDDEAIDVLRRAQEAASSSAEAEKARARIERIEKTAAERKQLQAQAQEQNAAWVSPAAAMPDAAPKHPAEPMKGPRRVARGIMRGVQCTYPAIIDFRVEGSGKNVRLYSNDYTALEYTVLGFLPKGNLHPCEEFEGMKARVTYVPSSDTTVDGQIVAMELRK